MIDRKARDILAEQLRHLVSGMISNDEFQARLVIKTQDAGVLVVEEGAWTLYSDLYTHKLVGKHALSKGDKRIVCYLILFLYSDYEYEWPQHPCIGLKRTFLNILNRFDLGKRPQDYDEEWQAHGNFEVFPFFRRSDFEKATASPRLLAGRKDQL